MERISLQKYDGKNVKLWTKDGEYYEGVCWGGTDYETEEDYLDFMGEGVIYEIMASEIEKIEIVANN
jgi:hypothetical protein